MKPSFIRLTKLYLVSLLSGTTALTLFGCEVPSPFMSAQGVTERDELHSASSMDRKPAGSSQPAPPMGQPKPNPTVIPRPVPVPSPLPTIKPTPKPTVTTTPPVSTNSKAHEEILKELTGFGKRTTGGAGGPVVNVTTLADSGPGSLREAARLKGAAWIRFKVSGVIQLKSSINIASDKTIDGRGADITLTENGLTVDNGSSNVIVTYLKFTQMEGDLLRMYNGGNRLWVHHCDFSEGHDGAIDTTEAVSEITISYVHLFNHDKTMLIGASSDEGNGKNFTWTAHHNWFNGTIQRLPFLRLGKAHSYNNLYNWKSGTAIQVNGATAQFLSENDILQPLTSDEKVILILNGGAAKFDGTWERPRVSKLNILESSPQSVFKPSASYNYDLDIADAMLETHIKANAGWKKVAWPESISAPDDSVAVKANPNKAIKVYLMGDSTTCDYPANRAPLTGWGMPFSTFFNSATTVENHAVSGASTSTFINTGRWTALKNSLKAGDYLFIAFGHNDEVDTKAAYTPPEQFQKNLREFVAEAVKVGAHPILLTPVTRLRFSGSQSAETHPIYSPLVRKVAAELKVPLIDNDRLTQNLMTKAGEKPSEKYYMIFGPTAYPAYPIGISDQTHFSALGALRIAEIVRTEIERLNLDLADRLK